jgi:hypothetical protein
MNQQPPPPEILPEQVQALNDHAKEVAASFPENLVAIPRQDWPVDAPNSTDAIWQSNKFYVQVHSEGGGIHRLSICRFELDESGQGRNDISFSQIMDIKRAVGFGDNDATEVFPRDRDRQRFGGLRNFFVLPFPVQYAFRNEPLDEGKEPSNIIITG